MVARGGVVVVGCPKLFFCQPQLQLMLSLDFDISMRNNFEKKYVTLHGPSKFSSDRNMAQNYMGYSKSPGDKVEVS